jgi:thiosulfate/3-mercaptopyruvate sulfurtransferase
MRHFSKTYAYGGEDEILHFQTFPEVRLPNPATELIIKHIPMRLTFRILSILPVIAIAAQGFAYQASLVPSSRLINPDELVRLLKSEKPLLIQVGSHVLYSQAHIPGSEYIGPASSDAGLEALRKRVKPLPRNQAIVLYCGCCPWSHCPNVQPADDALHAMGFTNVKVLYIANNFGADWVDKGYPVAKGE